MCSSVFTPMQPFVNHKDPYQLPTQEHVHYSTLLERKYILIGINRRGFVRGRIVEMILILIQSSWRIVGWSISPAPNENNVISRMTIMGHTHTLLRGGANLSNISTQH